MKKCTDIEAANIATDREISSPDETESCACHSRRRGNPTPEPVCCLDVDVTIAHNNGACRLNTRNTAGKGTRWAPASVGVTELMNLWEFILRWLGLDKVSASRVPYVQLVGRPYNPHLPIVQFTRSVEEMAYRVEEGEIYRLLLQRGLSRGQRKSMQHCRKAEEPYDFGKRFYQSAFGWHMFGNRLKERRARLSHHGRVVVYTLMSSRKRKALSGTSAELNYGNKDNPSDAIAPRCRSPDIIPMKRTIHV